MKLQCIKQAEFISTEYWSCPQILNSGINPEGFFFFEMPYITGDKYSEYLIKAAVGNVNGFISSIVRQIDKNLNKASLSQANNVLIKNKIAGVREAIATKIKTDPFIEEELSGLLEKIPECKIPIGVCHGDLTLSNMIVANDKIFLIDFLDSFIESPVIDYVKIRQETKFKWSLFLEKDMPLYQKNKIIQILNYFDEFIVKHYENDVCIKNWYPFLEKFNLLRILPYVKDKGEEQFIINALKNTNK